MGYKLVHFSKVSIRIIIRPLN